MFYSKLILGAAALSAAATLGAADASLGTVTSDNANRTRMPATVANKESRGDSAPSLYDGEVEDVGSQLLLLEAQPHDWFSAIADLQNYYTSNATLSESEIWSDVSVFTAQAAVNAKPFAVGSGKLGVSGGYRYQNFLYGMLSGRTNHIAGSGRMDDLDFGTHTGFLNAEWTQGGWSAGAGVRHTTFISRATDDTTYREWAPSLHGGYRFTLSERDFLSIDTDATYRFSQTALPAPFGTMFGEDLNDRYDLGATVSYAHIFGTRLLVQPAYRFQYTDYTQGGSTAAAGAGREDLYHTLSLTVGYYFSENFSARVFSSAEFRESSEADISDYANYNVGAGLMGSLTF